MSNKHSQIAENYVAYINKLILAELAEAVIDLAYRILVDGYTGYKAFSKLIGDTMDPQQKAELLKLLEQVNLEETGQREELVAKVKELLISKQEIQLTTFHSIMPPYLTLNENYAREIIASLAEFINSYRLLNKPCSLSSYESGEWEAEQFSDTWKLGDILEYLYTTRAGRSQFTPTFAGLLFKATDEKFLDGWPIWLNITHPITAYALLQHWRVNPNAKVFSYEGKVYIFRSQAFCRIAENAQQREHYTQFWLELLSKFDTVVGTRTAPEQIEKQIETYTRTLIDNARVLKQLRKSIFSDQPQDSMQTVKSELRDMFWEMMSKDECANLKYLKPESFVALTRTLRGGYIRDVATELVREYVKSRTGIKMSNIQKTLSMLASSAPIAVTHVLLPVEKSNVGGVAYPVYGVDLIRVQGGYGSLLEGTAPKSPHTTKYTLCAPMAQDFNIGLYHLTFAQHNFVKTDWQGFAVGAVHAVREIAKKLLK